MKKKILFVVNLLFGLVFINAGLNKFFNYMPVPEDLPEKLIEMSTAMAEIGWLMPLVALAEITGGILFISGKYRALGAVVIFPVMIGILLIHITVAPSGLPLALILFAILIWATYENRQKFMQLIEYRSNANT